MDEIFKSAVRSQGDFAGVFESDSDTAYFYLYDLNRLEGQKILSALHIASNNIELTDNEIQVLWDDLGYRVGLFIGGELWGVFNLEEMKAYGGHYQKGENPSIPEKEKF